MSTLERVRRRRADGFTQVLNDFTRDERISFRARGVLTFLVGHEPGWRITLDTLAKRGPEGRDALKTAIAELKRYGYVKISRERLPNGRLGATIWKVSDDPADLAEDGDEAVDNSAAAPQADNPPMDDEPQAGYPQVAEPQVAEPPALRRTSVKNTIQEEQHGNGPAAATESQREYLKDLHLHGGGASAEEVDAWVNSLTAAEADLEIKQALAALPRGRDYQGDPDNPDFTWKGREVAAARMLPGGKPLKARPVDQVVTEEALF